MIDEKIIRLIPGIILLISTILLAILIPTVDRKIKNLIKDVSKYEKKIENEKFNITLDSIQKLKIESTFETHLILEKLGSENKRVMENAMHEILLNNLNAVSKGKANIKEFSKKNDEDIIKETEKLYRELINHLNEIIKEKRKLEEGIYKLEKNKFIIYLLIIIFQSFGLILNSIINY